MHLENRCWKRRVRLIILTKDKGRVKIYYRTAVLFAVRAHHPRLFLGYHWDTITDWKRQSGLIRNQFLRRRIIPQKSLGHRAHQHIQHMRVDNRTRKRGWGIMCHCIPHPNALCTIRPLDQIGLGQPPSQASS
jgi:hypothetical protein